MNNIALRQKHGGFQQTENVQGFPQCSIVKAAHLNK